MSDSASNVNIEDVLTSIRRLVSTTRSDAHPDDMVPEQRRRFVLTEAHRVDEPAQVPEGTAAAEPVLTLETTDDAEEPALVLRDPAPAAPKAEVSTTAARMESALNNQDHEFEPDGSEVKSDEAWHVVADVPFVHARGAASSAAVLAERAAREEPAAEVAPADPVDLASSDAAENFEFAPSPEVEEPGAEDSDHGAAEDAPREALFDSVRTPPEPQEIEGVETGLSRPLDAEDLVQKAAALTDGLPGQEAAPVDEISNTGPVADATPVPEQDELEAELAAVETAAEALDQDDGGADEAPEASLQDSTVPGAPQPLDFISPLEPLPPLPPLPLNTDRAPQADTAPALDPVAEAPSDLSSEPLLDDPAPQEPVSFAPAAPEPSEEAAPAVEAVEDDPWSSEALEAAAEPKPTMVPFDPDAEKTRPPRFTDDTRLRRIVFEAEERAAEVFDPEEPEVAEAPSGEIDLADTPVTSDPGYELTEGAAAEGLPALALDEDELRELVSEIVRQELRGALGERITGNVRKLVRREIHRVLASYEFET